MANRHIARIVICSILIVCCSSLHLQDNDDPVERRWQQFKSRYNKSYASREEEHVAYENFFSNLRRIVKHNEASRTYRMDVNHMSDWTEARYQNLNGFQQNLETDIQSSDNSRNSPAYGSSGSDGFTAPSSCDWRTDDRRVGPVKNQGDCGACWAFATTGLLEGQQRMNSTGGVVPLSEQNLVDCDRLDQGCMSGRVESAHMHIKSVGGLDTESDYPYRGVEDPENCRYDPRKAFVTTRYLIRTETLEQGNEEILKETLAKYGPIAVAIDASRSGFRHYKSGVYYDPGCTKNVNHAVLLVGYGKAESNEDYWIIKNSWSTEWGQDGYAFMARNKDNHCGIAENAVISIAQRP